MGQYIVRRLLESIPTIIGVSIVIFLAFTLAPGDPISAKYGSDPRMTEERKAELRELYGLNDPLPTRYVRWIGDVLKGDFGESFLYRQPVADVLKTFIWNSFLLSASVLVLQWMLALVIGVTTAVRQYSLYDSVVTVLVFVAMSLPSFFFGLLLLKLFAVDYRIFPLGGMITTGADYTGFRHVLDVAYHMALPVITLTLLSIGGTTRYFRMQMLEVIRQDYIRTARAKGLKERVVVFKHALRNALLPLITLFTLELPGLFAGAIITERIFNWPGIGRVTLDGLYQRDYPLMMGFTLLIAFLTVLANILADVLYGVADPRVRHR
ncbi:MAG: ABC transporter permease [Hydrogenibacillus schlegelii]|uniref:ABC transporter permease n=1 Tax=Hydrogenibacillus schlegelii TaxID=1484 RepID=A0A947CXK7_HYDSH|nr:ABC transporter permease [Hydrogenibacillus schlegelii]